MLRCFSLNWHDYFHRSPYTYIAEIAHDCARCGRGTCLAIDYYLFWQISIVIDLGLLLVHHSKRLSGKSIGLKSQPVAPHCRQHACSEGVHCTNISIAIRGVVNVANATTAPHTRQPGTKAPRLLFMSAFMLLPHSILPVGLQLGGAQKAQKCNA